MEEITHYCAICGAPAVKDYYNMGIYCDDCVEESDNHQDARDNSSCYSVDIAED
jgi:hypothetical protein